MPLLNSERKHFWRHFLSENQTAAFWGRQSHLAGW